MTAVVRGQQTVVQHRSEPITPRSVTHTAPNQPASPGLLNRELELRLEPREVKFLLVLLPVLQGDYAIASALKFQFIEFTFNIIEVV
jgi:hypothetical protein